MIAKTDCQSFFPGRIEMGYSFNVESVHCNGTILELDNKVKSAKPEMRLRGQETHSIRNVSMLVSVHD